MLTCVLVLLCFVQLIPNFPWLPDPSLQDESESSLSLLRSRLHFLFALEFLVRFFRLCILRGPLHVASVMLEQHISVAWVALRALPCEGLLRSTLLLILTAVPGIMGVLCAPMLLA